ncbi:MAG: putative chemotaxis protein CheW [Labilithrix sp.]|nr:putative chemotaxis protein CheW [Labilithrix sp.]
MSDAALVRQAEAPLAEIPELFVLFKVDEADYALPAAVVLQMESYTGATAVPGAPAFVAGIVQLRGRVVPVVDLRLRFGLPPAVPGPQTRVVVGELHDRTVALVADSAREVIRLTPSQLRPPPRLVDDGSRGFIKAVAQLGTRTVLVLDFAKVIGEEPLDV